jgi:hypothetical protein
MGIGDAMVSTDIVDGVGGAIRVEFEGIVGTASNVANSPGDGLEIEFARADTGFCQFTNS